MNKKRIYALAVMVGIVSFGGFILENIWIAVTRGYCDNRNMNLPFIFGYGLAVLSLYLFSWTPARLLKLHNSKLRAYVAYFIGTFVLVSIAEIVVGTVTERLFGFYYWNYEVLPLHITRYTSVPTSLGFSAIIMLFMDKCFPVMLETVEKLPIKVLRAAAIIITVILTADFIFSFGAMIIHKKPNLKWIHYFRKAA